MYPMNIPLAFHSSSSGHSIFCRFCHEKSALGTAGTRLVSWTASRSLIPMRTAPRCGTPFSDQPRGFIGINIGKSSKIWYVVFFSSKWTSFDCQRVVSSQSFPLFFLSHLGGVPHLQTCPNIKNASKRNAGGM